MYLFFDTETTGLPRDWKAPVTKLDNWPRLVQLAYQLYDNNGRRVIEGNHIIKPDGFTIPKESCSVHGITTEIALETGEALPSVLLLFHSLILYSSCLVAHNMSYDEKIVGAEFLRFGMVNEIPSKKRICTKDASTDFCQIPGPYGFKWPALQELHFKLFETNFDGAHNALADIQATAKCFWELKKRGIIKLVETVETDDLPF